MQGLRIVVPVSPVQGYSSGSGAGLVVLAHSTALSGHLVSPINPRVILLGPDAFLAFNRGVQQVEIAALDRTLIQLNFYLVTFEQACNGSAGGCVPGDLYTPRIESDWLAVQAQDSEDLKNTPSDCRQCHQRGTETPLLLMRELEGPWTHFFFPDSEPGVFPEPSGVELLHDYLSAKRGELYAGIDAKIMSSTLGGTLQTAVDFPQPLVFDSSAIMNERWPWTGDGYPSEPSRSSTWYANYEAFKRGEQMALPYFVPRPTDPAKQAALTSAYQDYRAGAISPEELPDLGDIFPDDPQVRAEIGLQVEPNATPAEVLVQACGACHNDVLDQSISRARFTIDLARMDYAELELAIARMKLEPGMPGRMPPDGARQLDANALQRLLEYLENGVRSAEEDAFLQRAARIGMAADQIKSAL